MSTTTTVLGGIGLFLIGMSVMTAGLKDLAGSKLRDTLRRMAATPLSGAFWGAFVTLIVQSSSATTMTTIGLVSAGLLTFAQGLALVFGANVGTTGTGWLIALIGVRVSLTSFALPLIFFGALLKLLGRDRVAASGAALAGFALVLLGLTTLQQGMGGAAQTLDPGDFPAVSGVGFASGLWGVVALVMLGLAMTALMQSSTAAIAVTLAAHYAGAIALDQACALIIGQNIGTATSSALAAIGASITAKRLALAYVMFKLIAAGIALALFPLTTPLLVRASGSVAGVALLAAYHTAYNVVGVAVLLPLIDRFTRAVERLLPERRSPLTRALDPAALATPLAAEEAVRRTVARALSTLCSCVAATLDGDGSSRASAPVAHDVGHVEGALREAWEFIAEASGPPASEAEQDRLTQTLHALDEASRLAGIARETRGRSAGATRTAPGGADRHAEQLCVRAMQAAVAIADELSAPEGAGGAAAGPSVADLGREADELHALHATYRNDLLREVAAGALGAEEAAARIDRLRRLEALARHACRCARHLVQGE